MPHSPPAELARRLLAWYDRHARRLPWRSLPGAYADPYRVWLSEIMLQQTTVAAVEPYFHAFIARWPTVEALAAAPLDDVLAAWAGLGYYARARNLHACAKALVSLGQFPDTEEALLELPGVGAYTAAAVAAIAFNRKAVVVDGNVLRVMARLFAVEDPLPGAKPLLTAHAATLTPDQRAGDYAQAVMDLGATICTPKSPACGICPWRDDCDGRRLGLVPQLPARSPKAARPMRRGVAFWVQRQDGAVLLRRRPDKGLLGGMMEIPSTPWRAEPWAIDEALAAAPITATWTALPGIVDHVFTHFSLELSVVVGQIGKTIVVQDHSEWCPVDRLDERALPSVMRKIVDHALAAEVDA
ncbi:MAG TPA: A/G-specific adenine glycosylase [Magnetospirillaceae bacterium]|jgi:A/G-specific adenine glycosylase